MGQEPHYAFAFDVAERDPNGQWRALPPRAAGTRAEIGPSLRWLARRIAGYDDPAP